MHSHRQRTIGGGRPAAIFLFFLLMAAHLFAADYPVKYLGIDQGLSNNAVTSIYQDHNGFMWFGTYDGLNRYDGYQFKIFRNVIGDSNSLNSNTVYSIQGDAHHHLWIGGQKGACIFDPERSEFSVLKFIPFNNGAAPQKVQDIIHTIKTVGPDYMLLGTQHNGLLVFENNNDATGIQIPLKTDGGNGTNYDVTAIEFDAQKQLVWVLIDQAGLFRYDLKKKTLQLMSSAIQQANCLKTDLQGRLWLGNDNGLYLYDAATNRFSESYLPLRSKIVNLCPERQGTLWIGSDGSGLWLLQPGAKQATPFASANRNAQVNSNAVYAIYEDVDGRKWVGTLRGGVNMFESKRSSFSLVSYGSQARNNLVDNFIMSFCEDDKDHVWVGTDGAGLRYWDRRKNSFREYMHNAAEKSSISSNFITSIIRDYRNDIWISTWFGGVNRFNRATGSFNRYDCFNPATHLNENNIWLVYEDTRKYLWASATNEGSLYLFNREADRFDLFDEKISDLQCITEDAEGGLWGGNYSYLINIDRSGKKNHRFYNIGYTLRCLHEDRHRNFWIGTQEGGLLLFDRKTGHYKRFTTADGLPSNTILRMLEDGKGDLWLSTYNGLSRFNPQIKTSRNFSQSDGLQSNQFSFNAGLALSSGEFLFGGIKGFNVFYPDSMNDQADRPRIFLTGLKVNNTPVKDDDSYVSHRTMERIDQLSIPFERAVLSLDFIALEYTGADKIKYAYMLQGWDKDWNYVNGIRTANYSRLQEGNYIFKVRITNPDGTWSDATELMKITVLPPWYRTWWIYILYALCIAGAIYLYIRYAKSRERWRYEIKLAHLENEKDREITEKKLSFFTHISHEFRTPLTLIINPLKEMLQNTPKGGPAADLTVAYRNARRLLSLVDQLLLFRKADSGADILKISPINIVQLCEEVYPCFIHQAKARNIDYRFTANCNSPEIYADYEKIEIALFNLLSNAFKFTPAGGTILFSLNETEKNVTIAIKDTGCGINPADSARIFEKFQQGDGGSIGKTGFGIGLYLVKHFVEGHRGTVSCSSVVKEGTAFTITLLKGAGHLPPCSTAKKPVKTHELLQELIEDEQPASANGMQSSQYDGKTAEEVVTEKKSILLIDDDMDIIQYLQHIFGHKYLLYHAHSGTDGFMLARQHLPDLIISDINMEGMDGLELCAKIKQSDLLGHIPVILLTASTAAEVKLKGIEGGADDYVTKPFDKALLQARVETILKNRNLLQRYFLDSITLKETTVKVPAEYRDFLRKCILVVEENIDTEDFNIKKFSKAMGMSYPALYNKVKSVSGQPLNAFVRSIRLRRAAVLMLMDNMNINQAAFQVGIRDVKYFREQFVKLFGVTPSEYIKKYRHSFNREFNVIRAEKT